MTCSLQNSTDLRRTIIVLFMHAFLCNVCRQPAAATKRNSYLLKKVPTSVYGTSIIRYHSLECVIQLSTGWLNSGSNSTIRKSARAGEGHVFAMWGIAKFHQPWHSENTGFRSTAPRARNVCCDNQKQIQCMIWLNSLFDENVASR